VELNSTAADLLAQGLALCQLTDGALDLTACSAVQAWGFLSGEYRVPEQDELDALAASIDYTAVEQDGTKARLPAGMTLDLGSVAKGYTGDLLTQLLMARGVTSAILDLGHSSIQAVGTKPDGSPWRVGLQDPDGEDYLAVVTLQDQAMGTSGGYQRYFESDGVRYWHIIDPQTAAPARSGLASVTVIGPSGLICDGLSTALFVMGQEKGAAFWRNHPELDIQVIFISENGDIAITSGLSGVFSLATGYESREVTILE
jgi:thiamine biosynthesis lipoprotein